MLTFRLERKWLLILLVSQRTTVDRQTQAHLLVFLRLLPESGISCLHSTVQHFGIEMPANVAVAPKNA